MKGTAASVYPRLRRDSIIGRGLTRQHTLREINETLVAENEKTLS